MNYRKIGQRIRDYRNQKGLTQEELAFRISSSTAYISNIERGVKKPSLQKLIDIAETLQLTVNDFIYEDEPIKPPKEDEMTILLSKYDPIKQEELKRNFADILHTLSTN